MLTRKVLLTLASFHLSVMIIFGLFAFTGKSENSLYRIISAYAHLTGTDVQFDFFSPEIGSQLRIKYTITDDKGLEDNVPLKKGLSREAIIRFENQINEFWSMEGDSLIQEELVENWANIIFSNYPKAKIVKINIDEISIPNWNRYRNGEKVKWIPYSTFRFIRKGQS